MKTYNKHSFLIIGLLLITFSANAQTARFDEISSAHKRPKGKFTSYISHNGATYNIGDTIVIGTPSKTNTFAFIQGQGLIYAVGEGAPVVISGKRVTIKKFWIAGTKNSGYQVTVKAKGLTDLIIYFESAIKTGEVESFGLTSDQALAKLKKAKDKLDLEIITQAEYDKIKAELIKYIK